MSQLYKIEYRGKKYFTYLTEEEVIKLGSRGFEISVAYICDPDIKDRIRTDEGVFEFLSNEPVWCERGLNLAKLLDKKTDDKKTDDKKTDDKKTDDKKTELIDWSNTQY